MNSILDKILETKKEEVAALLARESMASLAEKARQADVCRGFARALQQKVRAKEPAVIAEIKRASPSKGIIRPDFDAACIAKSYAAYGAACLSVLTDRQYFQGGNEYFVAARAACSLPVIRKDFIIDAAQVYEARAIGADAILLIAAALSADQMIEFEEIATSLGMDVLVEVHDEAELQKALELKTLLLGVNNRDLKTFEVDLNRTVTLKTLIPSNKIIVCESGIASADDMQYMINHQVFGFLIGETFMRAENPGECLESCLSALRVG